MNEDYFAEGSKGVQSATAIIKGFFNDFHGSLENFLGTVHTTIGMAMNQEAERVIELQAPKFDGLEKVFIDRACKWSVFICCVTVEDLTFSYSARPTPLIKPK